MTPAQLQTIKEIFHGALDCEPDKASTFLETACQGDEVLRYEVDAFLTAHRHAGNFIEAPSPPLLQILSKRDRPACSLVRRLGTIKFPNRSAPAGWVKSIWPPTLSRAEKPRSNCCPCVLRKTPSASIGFNKKRTP